MIKKLLSCLFLLSACFVNAQFTYTSTDYIKVLKQATDIMVNDVTSPVAAGRYYAYITLAANESMAIDGGQLPSLCGKINGFDVYEQQLSKGEASFTVLYTMYRVAQRLLPSGSLLQPQGDSLIKDALRKGVPQEKINNSRVITDSVVARTMRYVFADHFRELSSLKKYTPLKGDAYWQPTAPGYMQALEPNWNTVRTFVLKDAAQCKPTPPVEFDTASSSAFQQLLREVYTVGKKLSPVQREIAGFWDCNPFALQQMGHIEFGLKKMSPGGHWISITGIACTKRKKKLEQTILIHTLVSLTMCDAFISCWDEKYRTNRVRPETAIRKWIDPTWKPLLQTPPFPEYTSGHSVVSAASALVLTAIFGDNFSFIDNSENEFGLSSRKFKSFNAAAAEAAISRLYGGIHYRDAVDNGMKQGKQIGALVLERLKNYVELGKKM